MADEPKLAPDLPDAAFASRDAIQRDLKRTMTSVAVLLLIVLGLALAAVFAGVNATRNLRRAEMAEAQERERLWNSLLAQARALRLTPTAGRREAALNVLSNAARIKVTPALRTEAIAALALMDVEVEGTLRPLPLGAEQVVMDDSLERFAYGNATGAVFVCRSSDGAVLQQFHARDLGPGPRQNVRSLAFNERGDWLAVRHDGGALVVWDLKGPRVIHHSAAQATNITVAGMAFWPGRDEICYSDASANGQITIHDLANDRRLSCAIRVGARTFRFRPGTMQVAITTDNRVDLSDYPVENRRLTVAVPTRVFNHVWSPAGDLLAIAAEDGDVYLWQPESGMQRVLRGHSEPATRLSFTPDGRLLATGSRDGTTRIWDVAQGQSMVVSGDGIAAGFSPDGQRIALWRPSVGYGTLRLARSEIFEELAAPKIDGALLTVDLSLNGRWCVATQSKGVRVWNLASGNSMFLPVSGVLGARISPDESELFVCDTNGLQRWKLDGHSSAILASNQPPVKIPLPGNLGARGVALSLDGRHAAVELSDLQLVVIDLESNTPPVVVAERFRTVNQRSPASPTGAGRFAISPDGRWLATGFDVGNDQRPKIWDAATGAHVATLRSGTALVVFSPDGKWLGTSGVNRFIIWSVGDWKEITSFQLEEPSLTHGSIAFTRAQSEVLITRSRQQAQLRDALSDQKFADLIPPRLQSVSTIRMTLDGSTVLSASSSDKLHLWHMDGIRTALSKRGIVALPESVIAPPIRSLGFTQKLLLGSTAGFAAAAVLALLTLRRHRTVIDRFLVAETQAAQRRRELEAAKTELLHGQKMRALGTLAAGIAHDFNNLLSVIRMSNKLIGRETKGNVEVTEHVADIEQAVLQGKNVVSSMLGYARSESNESQPTDLDAVVEETVSLLSREFLSGIALTLELDRHAPEVKLVRGRLEQVLLNLVVNASEAMQGQGKLKIVVRRCAATPAGALVLRPQSAGNYVELSVADSGPGIPAEIRERIFEPFFTTKRMGAKAGTGLGLSLVYSIAQQDGLGLHVDSEPGRGTTFSLLIPVASETAPVRQTHSSQKSASP